MQVPKSSSRYTRAATALSRLMAGPTLTLPLSAQAREVVAEYVAAATHYCEALEASGFLAPVGLLEQIMGGSKLLALHAGVRNPGAFSQRPR